jgi:glycosyltransferase involved in cell wall biosynthesis
MAHIAKLKIGIVYSTQLSPWGSCISISANLRAAHEQTGDDIVRVWLPLCPEKVKFDLRFGSGYFLRQAQALLDAGVSKIVILDHHLNIMPLLIALKILSPRQAAKMHYILHVYGDFTLYPDYWMQIGQELEEHRVVLLCASDRQVNLVRSFERDFDRTATRLCPFAVDTSFFRFDAKLRSEWRSRLKVGNRHLALYSGRVSLQKGVLTALEEFHLQVATGADAVLAIAGGCDDIGGPSLGLDLAPGYFYQRLNEALANLPPATRTRVIVLGNVVKSDLAGLYSAADSFVSLSLYHDEDFGMAPAEALSTGLPSLLADWGGYPGFAASSPPARVVPVNLNERGLSLNRRWIRGHWRELLHARYSMEDRMGAADIFAARFSIPNVAGYLREELLRPAKPFQGFNWRISVPKNKKNLNTGLYQDIYGHYATPKSEAKRHERFDGIRAVAD